MSNAEDCDYLARAALKELLTAQRPQHPSEVRTYARDQQCIIVSDSKNVYDGVVTSTNTASNGREKRLSLEVTVLKESLAVGKAQMRWCHSGSMIANGLTKPGEPQELDLYFNRGCVWILRYDPLFTSARKRRQAEVAPLELSGEAVKTAGDVSREGCGPV